jgi:prophage tail gpP-like protein
MSDDVSLLVGGRRYAGWKSIRITRSIETIAGSFSLDVSDRWDDSDPWPIAEGSACRVAIGDDIVIDGYVDKRRLSCAATTRTLAYDGRDRSGALVDCSALVDAGSVGKGGKWTFYNVDVAQLATAIAKPFGIKVSVQAGLEGLLTKNAKIVMHPGDTCFEVIAKVSAAAGVLVVSDAAGGIVITRAGTARATSLVESENILSASVEYDSTDRFHHYLISSQIPGTDEASGEATRIQAEAFDEGVARTERVLLIRPDKGYSIPDSRKRADWEARIRAARAEKVTVTVQGWRQPDGKLWPINALARVKASRMVGVDGDMLISQVEHAVGGDGKVTTLNLVRPDAFTPEPTATVHQSGGAWKELAKGAL